MVKLELNRVQSFCFFLTFPSASENHIGLVGSQSLAAFLGQNSEEKMIPVANLSSLVFVDQILKTLNKLGSLQYQL